MSNTIQKPLSIKIPFNDVQSTLTKQVNQPQGKTNADSIEKTIHRMGSPPVGAPPIATSGDAEKEKTGAGSNPFDSDYNTLLSMVPPRIPESEETET